VDDATSIAQLLQLSRARPFVEWGLLLSFGEAGSGRFPSLATIADIRSRLAEASVACALHLCGGDAIRRFIAGDPELAELAHGFGRVQLNFTMRARPLDLAALDRAIRRWHGPVITQHNRSNAQVWKALSAPNHQVLFDASGGRGIEAASWPAPLGDKVCGYAGGIGPENVARVLREAAHAAAGRPWWIDMEGKLRSPEDDRLDLDRCAAVLAAADDFLRGTQHQSA
jgi:hypothetical protein